MTGSSRGVSKQQAQILYSHDAKVYIAARPLEKGEKGNCRYQSQPPHDEWRARILISRPQRPDNDQEARAGSPLRGNKARCALARRGRADPAPGRQQTTQNRDQAARHGQQPPPFSSRPPRSSSRAPGSVRVVCVSASVIGRSPPGGVHLSNTDDSRDASALVCVTALGFAQLKRLPWVARMCPSGLGEIAWGSLTGPLRYPELLICQLGMSPRRTDRSRKYHAIPWRRR